MCDICGINECSSELIHMAGHMLSERLKEEYPNLRLHYRLNSLEVLRPRPHGLATPVLTVAFHGDRMKVWRCVPRYESEAATVLAADPDFINRIINILVGRTPEFLPGGFNR